MNHIVIVIKFKIGANVLQALLFDQLCESLLGHRGGVHDEVLTLRTKPTALYLYHLIPILFTRCWDFKFIVLHMPWPLERYEG